MPHATNGHTTIEITELQSQVYDALNKAALRISANNYAQAKRTHKKYTVTAEHALLVETMPKVLSGETSPEDAMALLHNYDVLQQRLGTKKN